MDRIRCIEVFMTVAQLRSFSAAARALEMSKSNVTKHVHWLEDQFGTRLLSRTTKSVGLTQSGVTLLSNGRDLLSTLEQLEAEVRHSVTVPSGAIRMGMPSSFGAIHLVPVVAAFTEANPGVQVVLVLDSGNADIAAAALDLTIKVAPRLKDANNVSQLLVKVPQRLVASKAYLERMPPVRSPADLVRHNCLVHAQKAPTSLWHFTRGSKKYEVRVRGSIRADFGEPLRNAAILGHGIAMHPNYMIDEDVRTGALTVVLPDYRPTELEIYAVYPSRRNLPLRVRTFLEFLKGSFMTPPVWASSRRGAVRDSG